jgi:putative tryptophan/tyrosine transport system substrate-binding protein
LERLSSLPIRFSIAAASNWRRWSCVIALPAITAHREFTVAGGLFSYGTSLLDIYRQLGVYAAKILKGEKAAELPVLQSTKVELVINLRTAKLLGLSFPIAVLGRADEVIE